MKIIDIIVVHNNLVLSTYLTIRLQAPDFSESIIDKGKTWVNYHLIEIESE